MSTDGNLTQEYLEQINAHVDNWARGGEYGPGGFSKDTAQKCVAFLLAHIADLQVEAREKNAWKGRYKALLEEREASRPREIDGGESSRGAASMTVALDVNGYPWLCYEGGWWRLVKDVAQDKRSELHPILAPYTIVYTPKGNNHD